jgi:hypothetical protein
MGSRALGKREEVGEVDRRASQAGSPIALTLFDLLADPTSTLRGLLRVSDLFCVRLTCKEAWRCIQHRPLTRAGVVVAAADRTGFGHHVPLLRWCLRNGLLGFCRGKWYLSTFGETGDAELVSELLKIEPKTKEVMESVLYGVAKAGHDELALQLLSELMELPRSVLTAYIIKHSVAMGGCVRTAAVIDDDRRAWVGFLSDALRRGHQRFTEWVLSDVELNAHASYVADAAESGSLELVKWVCAKGYAVGGGTFMSAAASGNVDLCEWVWHQSVAPTQSSMQAAVEKDNVDVLEWLSTKGCTCTSALLRLAVRTAGVPVVAWCLDHHAHPPDAGDLLALSCGNEQGSDVFEYLADQRGFRSSPTELMRTAAELVASKYNEPLDSTRESFDAAILVKRHGTLLFPSYLLNAIYRGDLGRLRFALSQGQEVSGVCYKALIESWDPTLLHEVLRARTVGGSIPEADQKFIKRALGWDKCHPNAKKVLADYSFFV